MGDSSLLKGALFFLCMILVVVLFMPKNCTPKALPSLRAARPGSEQKGLRIESSTPAPGARQRRPLDFPPGLDAQHVQYLVESDPRFSSPLSPSLGKLAGAGDPRLIDALSRLGYIANQPDGSVAFTNDGLLKADALDTGTSWTVPVARRVFVRLDSSTNCGGEQCSYLFVWKWEPNAIGTAMGAGTEDHDGVAVITGGEHHWGITDLQRIDQNL